MSAVLCADLGGSGVKLAALDAEGRVLRAERLGRCDTRALAQAIRGFCPDAPPERVALTGVGAAETALSLPGTEIVRVPELHAIAEGGLFLSGQARAVVASIGTGTALLYGERGAQPQHLGGTGVGGGTLDGLAGLILGLDDPKALDELSRGGDLAHVDLTIGTMTAGKVGTLPPETTAANFAALSPDATRSDVALGLVNLVLQAVGTMCVLCCDRCGADTVVLTGALTQLSAARSVFDLFETIYAKRFLIPPHAPFATAVGGALLAKSYGSEA